MQKNYKDILSHLSTEIDQETLLLYLQGKLTGEKNHEIEQKLLENKFADEALEGLQQFKDKGQLSHTIEMLNKDLKRKLERKKTYRRKLFVGDQLWFYLTLLILLLLIVIAYIVIRKTLN